MEYRTSNITTYATRDYEGFKRLLGNRAVTEERVGSIIDSINKVGYQPSPILVNEKFEIIDGQGRLEACKRLGLEVSFIIKNGIGIDECIAMNIKMKNWNIYDFIASYAAQGREDYIELTRIATETEELGIIEIALCLSDAVSRNIERNLREGYYKIKVTEETLGCLKFMISASRYLKSIRGGQQYYFSILVGLYKFNLIDDERMLSAITEHSSTMDAAYNAEDALTALQNVYNYRKHYSEYFRDKYLQQMQAKGARYKK